MLKLSDGREELWQWDTGREIEVPDDCSEVHFSNNVIGNSIDVEVIDGKALIPDVLLQVAKPLTAWAFVGTEEKGFTKVEKIFVVNRKNKPADYVFTPEDQTMLEEINDRLDKIEKSQDPDAIKNAVDEYLVENPVEVPVSSVNGKTGAVNISAEDVGAIDEEDLQEATNKALAQAKESGEFDGADGYTPIKGVDYFDGKDGKDGINGYTPIKGVDYFDGQKGDKGDRGDTGATGYTPVKGVDYFDGKDGTSVAISSVSESTTDGGNNIVTFSDGKILTIKNGSKGSKGDKGDTGETGQAGKTPVKNVDYFDGKDGKDGQDGTSVTVSSVSESSADGGNNVITFSDGKTITIKNGSKGSKGDAGQSGKSAYDYAKDSGYSGTEAEFTSDINPSYIREEVKEDLKGDVVQELIAELQGLPVFGIVDDNNIITITSQLSDGTYILKYENDDGTTTEIGSVTIGNGEDEDPAYTNQIPLSLASDGSEYVGHNGEDGYSVGYRLNSSGEESQQEGMCCTGYIPYDGETIRLANVNIAGTKTPYFVYCNADKSLLQVDNIDNLFADDGNGVYIGHPTVGCSFFRITCGVIDDTSIITLNEEIV